MLTYFEYNEKLALACLIFLLSSAFRVMFAHCRAFEASAFFGFKLFSTAEINSIPRLSSCRNRLWRKAGNTLIVESGSYKGELRVYPDYLLDFPREALNLISSEQDAGLSEFVLHIRSTW